MVPATHAPDLDGAGQSGFYYTRYPQPGPCPRATRTTSARVYFHVLGRRRREDPLVFGIPRPRTGPACTSPPTAAAPVIRAARARAHRRVSARPPPPRAASSSLIEGLDAIFGVDLRNDRLYLHDEQRRAPLGGWWRRTSIPRGTESWRDVLAEGPDVLEAAASSGTGSWPSRLANASVARLRSTAATGATPDIALPVIGTSPASPANGTAARCSSASRPSPFPRPSTAWPCPSRRLELWARATGEVDTAASACSQVRYPSRTAPSLHVPRGRARPRPRRPRAPPLLTGTAASTSA